MFAKRRIISHIYMWSFVIAGMMLAYIFIPSGILFYKNINISFLAIFLFLFLVYYVLSALWKRRKLHLSSLNSEEMKKIIKQGVYGKCIHPTCTTLAILGWIIFFLFPDLIIFISVVWLTAVIIFWIKIEKSFFLGKKPGFKRKQTEPA